MARYQITGPDGANYEITAPDGAAEKDVMDYFQANNGKGRPEQVLSAGDTAVDVAKSAGIGLAQGTIGLATLPGNVEALARTGVDAGARLAGIEDPKLSDNTFLPTYTDWKKRVEGVTGDFYEPKTQDPGLHQLRRRLLPHPPHPHAGSCPDRSDAFAGTGSE